MSQDNAVDKAISDGLRGTAFETREGNSFSLPSNGPNTLWDVRSHCFMGKGILGRCHPFTGHEGP